MPAADLNRILKAVAGVARRGNESVALHEPFFGGREKEYTAQCIDTGWVSSVGSFVDRFEKDLAERCGVARAVAVVNGTAALHVALRLAGIEPGDEVLTPALTFIATANAVAYCGATPHFVESATDTLGIDPAKLRDHLAAIADVENGRTVNKATGRRIAAIVPMHVFGLPTDMDGLEAVSRDFGIPIVEDAAEALGSFYHGRRCGSFGALSCLSFNGNKIITTGGGGAILTNDAELGARAKYLTTTAKQPHRWAFVHDEIGYNYRLPNINAALGCAQLEQLDGFLAAKRLVAEAYAEALDGIEGVTLVREPEGCVSNYWLNAVLLDDASQRDALLALTNDGGLMTRPVWTTMHRLAMYEACPRMELAVAEDIESRLVNLPSSAVLGFNLARRSAAA